VSLSLSLGLSPGIADAALCCTACSRDPNGNGSAQCAALRTACSDNSRASYYRLRHGVKRMVYVNVSSPECLTEQRVRIASGDGTVLRNVDKLLQDCAVTETFSCVEKCLGGGEK
jgi:hypothetical protein